MKLLIIGGGAVAESGHIPAAIQVIGVANVIISKHYICK